MAVLVVCTIAGHTQDRASPDWECSVSEAKYIAYRLVNSIRLRAKKVEIALPFVHHPFRESDSSDGFGAKQLESSLAQKDVNLYRHLLTLKGIYENLLEELDQTGPSACVNVSLIEPLKKSVDHICANTSQYISCGSTQNIEDCLEGYNLEKSRAEVDRLTKGLHSRFFSKSCSIKNVLLAHVLAMPEGHGYHVQIADDQEGFRIWSVGGAEENRECRLVWAPSRPGVVRLEVHVDQRDKRGLISKTFNLAGDCQEWFREDQCKKLWES